MEHLKPYQKNQSRDRRQMKTTPLLRHLSMRFLVNPLPRVLLLLTSQE